MPLFFLANLLNVNTQRVAFLDGPNLVRYPLGIAVTRAEAKRLLFKLTVDGKPIPIQSVDTEGDPVSDRTLPRTPGRVILAGTLQSALGGRDWDPDGETTQMIEVSPDVFELDTVLKKGNYEYKVARNGTWAENYGQKFVPGGANLSLIVASDNTPVRFRVDFRRHMIANSIQNPQEVSVPTGTTKKRRENPLAKFTVIRISLAENLKADDVSRVIDCEAPNDSKKTVVARDFLDRPEFQYQGKLGSEYSRNQTVFRVWSPPSESASVLFFKAGQKHVVRWPMNRAGQGVWQTVIRGDLRGQEYLYEFRSYGETRTAADIYSLAATEKGHHSVVIRPTNPVTPIPKLRRHNQQTDAVIYEISVRDFTALPSSGVEPRFRGKYAGLTQSGTRIPGTQVKTGLDYLKALGVTDIHLLPVQSFLSSPQDYSWGYATNLFNVPERSYAVQPASPVDVTSQFGQMVSQLHQSGLRVVMDVVYNHTWPPEGKDSAFWQTVPYFYFRTNLKGELQNESGVGNALDDDHPIVRKYVRDSLLYWQKQFGVDGFRFDLMGMFTKASILDWSQALRNVRPDTLFYGEPWTGGGPTRFGSGTQRGTHVAIFNDRFRNTLRGDLDGSTGGFVMGAGADPIALKRSVTGWTDSANRHDGITQDPDESINYVSAHDNMTLWDRIGNSIPATQPKLKKSAVNLANAMVLLSEGVPFLEGGAELGRTKGGNPNSYNAGDAVNAFDWRRGLEFQDTANYLAGLIAVRKSHPAFRLASAAEIHQQVAFLTTSSDKICYLIRQPDRTYLVVFHGARTPNEMPIPKGNWKFLVTDTKASEYAFGDAKNKLKLSPLSAYVLVQKSP